MQKKVNTKLIYFSFKYMQYFFLHQYFQELLIRRVNDNSHQGSNEICLVKKKNLIHFFYRSDPQVSNQTSVF